MKLTVIGGARLMGLAGGSRWKGNVGAGVQCQAAFARCCQTACAR